MKGALAIAAMLALCSASSIVDLAVATPDLSTLVAALKAADLVGTLSGTGPFTVFAPTNEAFAALPKGALDSLLLPENKATLSKLLTYHVVAADIHAKDILHGEGIRTVEGQYINATVDAKSGIMINQAKVISADNNASNGVVHIINAVLLYPGFAPPATPAPAPKTIVDLALATPDLSTLVTALKAADLVGTLSGTGPFTVFAPTNEAFAALPTGVLDSLLLPENKATLVKVLTYHVAAADIHAKDILDGERIKTVEGDKVMAAVSKSGVQINQAKVTSADNDASNGVVHVIDAVLTYPGFAVPTPAPAPAKTIVELAVATPDLSTLVTALKAANLTGVLSGAGPFTVFAPTNEAFAALPAGTLAHLLEPKNVKELQAILEYHVSTATINGKAIVAGDLKPETGKVISTVEGDKLRLDRVCLPSVRKCETSELRINPDARSSYEAKVTAADNAASNGVVHIIDTVLTSFLPPGKTIVDLAVATPDLSTLVAALKAADLVGTLSGTGPFTVFAPTNEAFAALPKGVLASLLLPENKATLVKVLTYHVAAADIHAKDILDGQRIKTVEGDKVTAKVSKSGVQINQAKVTTADIDASNGVVHIIDAVLTYPGFRPTN